MVNTEGLLRWPEVPRDAISGQNVEGVDVDDIMDKFDFPSSNRHTFDDNGARVSTQKHTAQPTPVDLDVKSRFKKIKNLTTNQIIYTVAGLK